MKVSRSTLLRHCRYAAMALIVSGGAAGAAAAETLAERANRGLVELMTSDDPASIEMAQDLANLLDDGATRRVLPVVGHGGVPALIDLKALRGVDMSIVQTDVLDYAKQHGAVPGLDASITYIAKLHIEELHVLARADIRKIEDLAGKKVNFGGGATITGPAVLELLQVKVVPVFDNRMLALQKLKSGEIAAVAYVAAKPAPLFDVLRGGEGLHLVAIPYKPALSAAYLPARFTADDYPRLVAADQPIDTIGVGTVLVAVNLQPDTERYHNLVNFVDALFTQFPRLQEEQFHPKWRDVNLAAELSGWKRFATADTWLKRNAVAAAPALNDTEMHLIFSKFLDERTKLSGGSTLSTQEKDQLFNRFRQWQATQVR
jgi:TRAP-type uncharacterized transport system substrate-binding protein